jgi:hypothetical protein
MASDGYGTSRDLDNSGQRIDFRYWTGALSRGVSGALTRPTQRWIATTRRRMPLNRLKLTAIRDQLDSLVDEAVRRELTIREALSLSCEREIGRKDERRIEMSIGLVRFPFVRDLDGFDIAAQPSPARRLLRRAGAASGPTGVLGVQRLTGVSLKPAASRTGKPPGVWGTENFADVCRKLRTIFEKLRRAMRDDPYCVRRLMR